MKAFLILEDGTVFEGTHIGAEKEIISEIVFDTAMVGYLDVLTDPSYAGEAVCMTYPLIGNYGICKDDMQSLKAWPDGFIVRELSRIPSNFRCEVTIQEFLEENNIPGIAGIDTRALTKILRDKGTMNGMITTNANYVLDDVLALLKEHKVGNVVEKVTCKEKYTVAPTTVLEQNGPMSGSSRFDRDAYESGVKEPKPTGIKELSGKGLKVAILDLGVKAGMISAFTSRGCEVTVYPASTSAEEIIASKPDGIMISNGPGDPKENVAVMEEVKKIYNTDIPVMAIGLGHQMLALATGGDTYKMQCGHRGGNNAAKDLESGRVRIVSQCHGYAVDADKLNPDVAVPAFVNVNDGTVEGVSYKGKKILSVQFHPEAFGGAHTSSYLYEMFMSMMKGEN